MCVCVCDDAVPRANGYICVCRANGLQQYISQCHPKVRCMDYSSESMSDFMASMTPFSEDESEDDKESVGSRARNTGN